MANYESACRTNYFEVTDDVKYQELLEALMQSYDISKIEREENGKVRHAFGTYEDIDLEYVDGFDGNWIKEMQSILPDGEAFVLIVTGHEKLSSVSAGATIITNDAVDIVDLETMIGDMIAEKIDDDHPFITQC